MEIRKLHARLLLMVLASLLMLPAAAREKHRHPAKSDADAATPGLPPLDNSDGRWNGVHYVDGDIIIDGQRLSQVKKCRIWGRMFAQDNNAPIAGATIRCEGEHMRDMYRIEKSFTAVTDVQGNYELTNLPPDTYWLQLDTPCVSPQHANLAGITVYEGDERHYDIPVSGSAIVEGQLVVAATDAPVAGAKIWLMPLSKGIPVWDGSPWEVKTDREGRFRFIGVPESRCILALGDEKRPGYIDGQYDLRFQLPSGAHAKLRLRLTEKATEYRDGAPLPGTVEILPPDADGTPPQRGNGDGCALEGQVIEFERHDALAEAVVHLTADTLPPVELSVTTDQQGHFHLSNLKPGKYKVTSVVQKSAALFVMNKEDAEVVLPAGGHRTLSFSVKTMWDIALHIIDRDGREGPPCWVEMLVPNEQGGWESNGFIYYDGPDSKLGLGPSPNRKIRLVPALKGVDCKAAFEGSAPEDLDTKAEIRLPCANADIPIQPAEVSPIPAR